MEDGSSIRIDRLRNIEQAYRARVRHAPGDTHARLSLAWCLAFEAIYESGRENEQEVAWANGSGRSDLADTPPFLRPRTPRSGRALLRNCLRQIFAVELLSDRDDERAEATRLRDLIRLTGADSILHEAEARAERTLDRLAAALMSRQGMTDFAAVDPF